MDSMIIRMHPCTLLAAGGLVYYSMNAYYTVMFVHCATMQIL